MHPIIFEFGSFSIKAYGLFVAIGFLAGISFALREARRQGYDPQRILDLSFYIILGAIIGSRIFYVITNFSAYRANVWGIFKVWEGGLTFYGGFIFALMVGIFYIRKYKLPVGETLDLLAPALALGEFFGRIGCFFAGCCYGTECTIPWAVTFTNPQTLARMGVPLHPTQLYSSAAALITFLLLLLRNKKKTFHGQIALMWIILYSSFRVIIEFYRGDPRGYLILGHYAISQALAVLLIIISLIIYLIMNSKSRA